MALLISLLVYQCNTEFWVLCTFLCWVCKDHAKMCCNNDCDLYTLLFTLKGYQIIQRGIRKVLNLDPFSVAIEYYMNWGFGKHCRLEQIQPTTSWVRISVLHFSMNSFLTVFWQSVHVNERLVFRNSRCKYQRFILFQMSCKELMFICCSHVTLAPAPLSCCFFCSLAPFFLSFFSSLPFGTFVMACMECTWLVIGAAITLLSSLWWWWE